MTLPSPSPITRVVLWVIDDLSCTTVLRHGNAVLARLLKRGAFFPRCWATPLCRPSRAALLTGRYGARTGHLHNTQITRDQLSLEPWRPIPMLLDWSLPGVYSSVVGKWQHFDDPGPLGFADCLIWRTDKPGAPGSAKFLADYLGPREPADGPMPGRPPRYTYPYLEHNRGLQITSPGDFGPDLCEAWALSTLSMYYERQFLFYSDLLMHKEWDHATNQVAYPFGLDHSTVAQLALSRLEHFLNELHLRGLEQSTLVLVTSDNGTTGGDKGATTKQKGMRVPCFAFGPGVVPGVRPHLIDATDFAPTILQAFGSDIPGRFGDGHSFFPALYDPTAHQRGWIMSSFRPPAGTEGPLGIGPAIRNHLGQMIDHDGNVWSLRHPHDPFGEYWSQPGESEITAAEVAAMIAVREIFG